MPVVSNQGSRIIYITEKHVRQHAQSTTSGLIEEASIFRLTGRFHIHLFYLSKHCMFLTDYPQTPCCEGTFVILNVFLIRRPFRLYVICVG